MKKLDQILQEANHDTQAPSLFGILLDSRTPEERTMDMAKRAAFLAAMELAKVAWDKLNKKIGR